MNLNELICMFGCDLFTSHWLFDLEVQDVLFLLFCKMFFLKIISFCYLKIYKAQKKRETLWSFKTVIWSVEFYRIGIKGQKERCDTKTAQWKRKLEFFKCMTVMFIRINETFFKSVWRTQHRQRVLLEALTHIGLLL